MCGASRLRSHELRRAPSRSRNAATASSPATRPITTGPTEPYALDGSRFDAAGADVTSPECFATTTDDAAEPAPGTVASTRMWSPGRAEVTYEIRQVWPSRSAIER